MSTSKHLKAALAALAITTTGALAAAPAHAYGTRYCGNAARMSVSANAVTSCGFARNTAIAVSDTGSRHPWVYSPATGRVYHMNCVRLGYNRLGCSGGNHAYVRLEY